MTYIQGDLQVVFDALYHMGMIDPVLEMDWREVIENKDDYSFEINQVMEIVNRTQGNLDALMVELKKFDPEVLSFLAMEVAREFADYHARESLQ